MPGCYAGAAAAYLVKVSTIRQRGDPADQFSAAALRGQWSRAVSQACSHGIVDMSEEEQRDAVLRKVPQEREAWDYEAQGPPLTIDIDTLEQVLGTLDVTKSPGSAGVTNTFLKAMTFQYHGERARRTTRWRARAGAV